MSHETTNYSLGSNSKGKLALEALESMASSKKVKKQTIE